MSRLPFCLVALVLGGLLAASPARACRMPGSAETNLFDAAAEAPAEAEVVAEVVLTDIDESHPATATATIKRVLKASDPRVRPGEKFALIYGVTTCGHLDENGDQGLIYADLATGADGRLLLCPYHRRPRDGMFWPPRAVGDCRPEEVPATDQTRMAAEKGEPRAQFRLGQRYEQGWGVRPNYPEALKWLCAAAEGGDDWARKWFRELERREDAAALELFQTAAASEEPGVRAWFLSAARGGSAKAQYELGVKYWREDRHIEALRWFQLSASQGQARAMVGLGRIYRYGGVGVQPDRAEAVKWLALAAAQASRQAQADLKDLYK